MNQSLFKKIGFAIVATVSVTIWALLLWQHYHGGVPSHSFLARKDMPSISNWWGAILLPLLTYFSLYRIQKRIEVIGENNVVPAKQVQSILLLFALGLTYTGLMSYCFVTDNSDLNGLLFQGLFLLAFILPIYRIEFFLGFVLGMTYTFGAILPTFIGSLFVGISYIAHKWVYPFVLKIFRKMKT
jgi:hypothetical protein